ncbi:MAG: methyltransferase [Gemmatimonadales bacterium]
MDAPRLGSKQELAALRDLLRAASFAAPEVCLRLGIDTVYDFRSIREGRTTVLETVDPLDLLIRLFMDVELVERETVEGLLPPGGMSILEQLGMLTPSDADDRLCHATVLLYPTESLWIASDLNVSPAGVAETVLQEDAVYPAVSQNTRHFLSSLPKTPCESFLELCAGTGIAALLASRYAGHTWATDITERATRFARFNAALNGIENCTAVRGDLYEAVAGRVFDRIVAHPPYMPSLEQKYIFRDGGEDGEQITRRIIGGLPDYLRPGGRFYCTCMLTERKGARAEDRIRAMLGSRQSEFDVLLVTVRSFQPTEYYFRLALEGRAHLEEVVQRHQIFQHLEVEQLIYCSMVVQRIPESRPAFTARRQAGHGLGTKEVERLLRWEATVARPERVEQLIQARPTASPHCRLRLTHVLQGEAWAPEDCFLSTNVPFTVEAKCPPWTAALVARCDGRRTTREQLQFLKESGAVPLEASESEFVRFVRSLIAGGFLQVADPPDQPLGAP